MARVLLLLAEGFEEIEAVTVVDLLRRAGIEVCSAALAPDARFGSGLVCGSHGIAMRADALLADVDDAGFDMVVLPGGMPGAENLKQDVRVLALLERASSRGGYLAAICAAPSVLAHAGLLDDRAATSFPGFLDAQSTPGLQLSTAPVVIDGRIVTSRGPGTAIDFSLTLIELLVGCSVREQVESRLQRPPLVTPQAA
jgi:4-methyl-5(b-hydroxyethyl)-thiazole monophosphate biosynthesis